MHIGIAPRLRSLLLGLQRFIGTNSLSKSLFSSLHDICRCVLQLAAWQNLRMFPPSISAGHQVSSVLALQTTSPESSFSKTSMLSSAARVNPSRKCSRSRSRYEGNSIAGRLSCAVGRLGRDMKVGIKWDGNHLSSIAAATKDKVMFPT